MSKHDLKICEIMVILLDNVKVKEELITFAKLWRQLPKENFGDIYENVKS